MKMTRARYTARANEKLSVGKRRMSVAEEIRALNDGCCYCITLFVILQVHLFVLLHETGILMKEGKEQERLLRRFYHLLKAADPQSQEISGLFGYANNLEKLQESCKYFCGPVELMKLRVIGYMSRISCLGIYFEECGIPAFVEKLPDPAKLIAKSIPEYSSMDRAKKIEKELFHLGECDDEDICMFTMAYYRFLSVDNGATPIIGGYRLAYVWKWMNSLLSNRIPSVIIEALQIIRRLSSLRVRMKFENDIKTNSLLTLNSFVPLPALNESSQMAHSLLNPCSSDWIPRVFARGSICSIAILAFECLQKLSSNHLEAFNYLLSQNRIMEKVMSYLLGNWSEDERKAIFPGSKFLGANCADVFSSGGVNFQQMSDGLYCEEESFQKMIARFQLCAVLIVKNWLARQLSDSINGVMKRNVMGKIASLLCCTANEHLRLEATKAIISGWSAISINAHIRPICKKRGEEVIHSYKCLDEPVRKELKEMLMEVCEEEGVIDSLLAHIAPEVSKHTLKAKKEQRMKNRLKAKCDRNLCPVCQMFTDSELDDEKQETESNVDFEEETNEKVENANEIINEIPINVVKKHDEEYYATLLECLNARGQSANEFAKLAFNSECISCTFINYDRSYDIEDKCYEAELEREGL
ncbi:uncharacterized protein MONOS_5342 [Monocercomonoides exilis]|uniref:uncharacterized protein n=1 Tax=Monocercomonoides exilis TaxID=2049356 RepID=UPI003559BED9|nr:hypothetical protein MONOS_5342 [Monocercomonoides exilis]